MTFQPQPPQGQPAPPPPPQGSWQPPQQTSAPQGSWAPPPPPAQPPAGQPGWQQPAQQTGGGYSPMGAGGAKPAFDPKTVHTLDWAIIGCGVIAFIFSFVSYYTFGPYSTSAWHGFFGWFAMLCALVGSAALAAELFAPQMRMSVAPRLLGLGAYAVATLCIILALFIYPYSGFGVGHGFGYWISLIVIIAGLVLSYLRFTATGGTLPFGPGARPGGQPRAPYGPPQ